MASSETFAGNGLLNQETPPGIFRTRDGSLLLIAEDERAKRAITLCGSGAEPFSYKVLGERVIDVGWWEPLTGIGLGELATPDDSIGIVRWEGHELLLSCISPNLELEWIRVSRTLDRDSSRTHYRDWMLHSDRGFDPVFVHQ